MAIQGTVPVGGSFAPTDPADSFGTHNDKWGIGGYRIVKTITDRNAIPVNESNLLNLDDALASGRRKLGMMVYVSDEAKLYVLTIAQATWDGYTESQKVTALATNTNFVEFVGGGGSGLLYGNATNGGSGNIYTTTIDTVTSYNQGDSYLIKFDANNTGDTKININSIGEARIYKEVITPLEANDIIADKIYIIAYDGENFQVLTVGGGGTGDGITKFTVTGPDTYTITGVPGVSSYVDGDTYLVRFTNGNTTSATLEINGLGSRPLLRNNDGPLIGGDIFNEGEMLCVYNSTSNGFQCIGSSPNSLFAYVTNAQGSTINRGQVVYAFGGTGDRMEVKLASNSGDSTSAKTVGVVYSTSIAANQKGIILMQGHIDGLDIVKPNDGWADGDSVYLGATAGSITKTKPYAPAHLVYVATVTTASNGNAGRMYVKIQNGYELDEIHDVDLITTAPVDGDVLAFVGSPTNLWRNISSTSLSISASNLSTGTVPLARLGTNSPTTNTYLAWDNTWRTATASGTIASGTARRLAIYTSTTGLDDTLDAGNTAIVVAAHATGRVYTIDNVGAAASFVMTEGAQNIVGTKSFTGSAGPLQFTQIGVGTFTGPTTGATPSLGTRIVIAPGATGFTPLSFGWSTNYEFWMAGRHFISFYPRNQTSSVGAFEYVATSGGTTGLILSSTYSTTVPALRSTGWLLVAGLSNSAPTSTTRSAGTKILLIDNVVNNFDAAIGTSQVGGVGANFTEMWFTSPSRIAFYTGGSTTNKLLINASGVWVTDNVGFYGTTPVVKGTTANITGLTFVQVNTTTLVSTASTFGGYTLAQIASALQRLGLIT